MSKETIQLICISMPPENAENQRSSNVFRRYRNANQSTHFFMMGKLIVSEFTHFMLLASSPEVFHVLKEVYKNTSAIK